MVFKRIDNFLSKFKKYFFSYNDGFFVLPVMANSPQAMVDNLTSLPFVDANDKKKYVKTKNPLFDALLYYIDLEDGLSIHLAETAYKTNLNFKLFYDKNLPADYYFLNLYINQINNTKLAPLVNGLSYTNRSWSFFKPKISNSDCHFKDTNALFVTVYFTEIWLQNYLKNNDIYTNRGISKFIESKNNYIIWPDLVEATNDIYKPFINIFKSEEISLEQKKNELYGLTINFINHFFIKYDAEKIYDAHFEISDSERLKILKIEKILTENLLVEFIGIENLAKEIGMSATKVKLNFKLVFGMTIYQYYIDKRMKFAKEKLINSQLKIKEVSEILGYENQGKFSSAFKKQFGFLPSQIPTKS